MATTSSQAASATGTVRVLGNESACLAAFRRLSRPVARLISAAEKTKPSCVGSYGKPLIRLILARSLAFSIAVVGQSAEDGIFTKREPKRLHVTDEPALLMADRGQGIAEFFPVPAEPWPVGQIVNVQSPHFLPKLCGSFSAGLKLNLRKRSGENSQ
jgi:hypothetical protein